MQVAQALYKLISTAPGVLAVTSVDNVYPGKLPQDVRDKAIVLRRKPMGERIHRLNPDESTQATGGSGLQKSFWYVFSVGLEPLYDTQAKMDKAVERAIDGFQGVVVNATVSPIEQIEIQGIFHTGITDDFYDDKTQTFQVVSVYEVWATE